MNATKAHIFTRLETEFEASCHCNFRLETFYPQLVEMVIFRSLNIQPS